MTFLCDGHSITIPEEVVKDYRDTMKLDLDEDVVYVYMYCGKERSPKIKTDEELSAAAIEELYYEISSYTTFRGRHYGAKERGGITFDLLDQEVMIAEENEKDYKKTTGTYIDYDTVILCYLIARLDGTELRDKEALDDAINMIIARAIVEGTDIKGEAFCLSDLFHVILPKKVGKDYHDMTGTDLTDKIVELCYFNALDEHPRSGYITMIEQTINGIYKLASDRMLPEKN